MTTCCYGKPFWCSLLVIILFTSGLYAKAQADISNHRVTVLDADDRLPVTDAHVCIETSLGHKSYSITNNKGTAVLTLPNEKNGMVSISKVGYVTNFIPLAQLLQVSEVALRPDVFNLEQVVVTGSSMPTPVDSSIYKVKLITEEKIRASGSMNLGELLLNEANLRITNDLITGSQIEMLGLSGQNVKIMIDGVPIIGRLDGNIDLSQINMADIAQVEIIEGPMSVVYGNNALAGTINLITKRNKYHAVQVQAQALAESVQRYSGNLSASKKLGEHNLQLGGGYEHFGGVDFNTANRSMDWKPKDLYRINAAYGFSRNQWDAQAKFNTYHDALWNKSNLQGTWAYDTYFYTNRNDVGLNLSKRWHNNNHLSVVSAYNTYERSSQRNDKDLSTGAGQWGEKQITQEANQQMLRGIYTFGLTPTMVMQLGSDLQSETMEGQRISDGSQTIADYAGFVNVTYAPVPQLELQPGVRLAYNSKYKAPLVYSINARWAPSTNINWRASVAKGFRAPDLKELFYEFVDSNHEIFGNPELSAEQSINYSTSAEYTTTANIHKWRMGVTAYYNDIDNLITLVQDQNSTKYVYQNIDNYKTAGGSTELNYAYNGLLTIRLGYGLTARHNSYTSTQGSEYNLSHDAFAGLKLREPATAIQLVADYKYNGSIPFLYTNEEGSIKEGLQDAYNTMNLSINRNFLNQKLLLTAGGKNLFNVTSVNLSGRSGGAHSGGSSVPVSYGRSWFISLSYRFTK